MDLAELYESVNDYENASKSYEQAGDYFTTDHAEALANKAFLKCADLYALNGNYKELWNYTITSLKPAWEFFIKMEFEGLFFKVVLCVCVWTM